MLQELAAGPPWQQQGSGASIVVATYVSFGRVRARVRAALQGSPSTARTYGGRDGDGGPERTPS